MLLIRHPLRAADQSRIPHHYLLSADRRLPRIGRIGCGDRHDGLEVGSGRPRIGHGGRRDGLNLDSGDLSSGRSLCHAERLEEHHLEEEVEVLAQPVARPPDQRRHLWQRCLFNLNDRFHRD